MHRKVRIERQARIPGIRRESATIKVTPQCKRDLQALAYHARVSVSLLVVRMAIAYLGVQE